MEGLDIPMKHEMPTKSENDRWKMHAFSSEFFYNEESKNNFLYSNGNISIFSSFFSRESTMGENRSLLLSRGSDSNNSYRLLNI